MKLIGSNLSPYARKARLVLLEKNIPHEWIIDSPREKDSKVPQFNPLGRIPALILDDGTCIFDSPVIAEYADSLNDNPILIPREDAHAKMIVKRWEALADGIMDSAILVRTESMRLLEKQDPAVIIRYNEAVSRALAFAAQELTANEWCAGGQLSLADLALVSALIYVDLRQPEREWRMQHPNLAQFFERLSARESVKIAVTGG